MYTLEDDEETSGSLRKSDFHNSPYAASPEEQAEATVLPTAPAASQPSNGSARTVLPTAPLPETVAESDHTLVATPTSDSSEPLNSPPGRGRRLAIAALIVACASVFVTSMDETVVVTALPKIISDPGINIPITELDHAAWIVSAYLLGFVIAMPLMGRVSDIFGRRRIMLICLSIFGLGSIVCALSPVLGQAVDISFLSNFGIDTSSQGLIWLIAARFVQAVGGGAVVPVAMAIVSDFYGQKRLGIALGLIGAVTEAGGVVGPLYGALIVQTLGWTFIFFLNVPIVIALILGTIFCTPKHQRLREGVDWPGAILLGLALTCLSLGLAQQGTELGPVSLNGSTPQNNPLALVLAIVFLVLFVLLGRLKSWRVPHISLRRQLRVTWVSQERWPVIDLSLFKRLPFSAASLVSLFVGAALIIAMADIPLYVDTVLSQQVAASDQALVSGLALLRMTAMIPVGALLGGWLCSRLSCRLIGILGLLFTAAGFYMMSRWSLEANWTQMTISTLTAGLGFGLVIAPISTTAINSVRANQAGMGSAIVTALRMVGMILGLAALTSWGLAYFKQLAAQFRPLPSSPTPAQFAQWTNDYTAHVIVSAHTAYCAIFFVTMVLCLIALVPACFLWGRQPVLAELVPNVLLHGGEMDDSTITSGVPVAPAATVIADDTLAIAPAFSAYAPVEQLPFPRPPQQQQPRRRLLLTLICIGVALLLLGTGLLAFIFWPASSSSSTQTSLVTPTATPVAGPRAIDLALNNTALTSIFVSELGTTDNALSNMQASPLPNNGLSLKFDLNINSNGLQRTLPVEIDATISLDAQHNLQLKITHVIRDGNDAGPEVAASMQTALNQMLLTTVMPALHAQLQNATLTGVQTSSTVSCGGGQEMLVLLIQAPPVQGSATQTTPTTLCFTKAVNLNNLLP